MTSESAHPITLIEQLKPRCKNAVICLFFSSKQQQIF